MRVDLNADMGESFGPWVMGNDAALLDIVTSANIACGFHAGDPDTMAKTMALAAKNGVGIGAHPGFDDLEGFGRRRLPIAHSTLQNQIRYQVGSAMAMAASVRSKVRHVKLHGALGNMTSEDYDLAYALFDAVRSVDDSLTIMVLAATQQQKAADALGMRRVCEIFADRAYNEDATLVDRSIEGAVIHDPAVAGPRITDMVKRGGIVTLGGKLIPTDIDTICLHGDTPTAVEIARSVRGDLEANGVTVTKFDV